MNSVTLMCFTFTVLGKYYLLLYLQVAFVLGILWTRRQWIKLVLTLIFWNSILKEDRSACICGLSVKPRACWSHEESNRANKHLLCSLRSLSNERRALKQHSKLERVIFPIAMIQSLKENKNYRLKNKLWKRLCQLVKISTKILRWALC